MKSLALYPMKSLCLIFSLLVLAGGCRRAESAKTDKPEVALVLKSLANEFFKTMADSAEKHHAANAGSYTLLINGTKDETDLGQQVNLVDQMIARGVDAIVIAPADSKALVPVLKRAQDAGILVINIDNRLDDETVRAAGLKAPFVGPDNRIGARSVGEALATQLKPKDQVAIIEGLVTAYNGRQRRLGFEEAMQAAGMDIVSVQAGNWEMAKANTVAAAMLNRYPDLKALLCANDNMALGAAAAVAAAGRNEVKIVGFDNIVAVAPLLADGRLYATADQHAAELGIYGIEAALQIIAGKATPADRITPVDLVVGHSR